ncbi:hypothetical protein [Bdellovibrio sp. NC01]|uniref:hypothetical protein n=1 Tax=Bdellovibrio sp. NC01 TaxID=2220073 RepID=UPI00115BDF3D|nr:hypothetical protein [Bdellovibrio sp. NC01]QDK38758.1 hypothetical protein DOE51_14770 [Bdellovibrio sp. NC01]
MKSLFTTLLLIFSFGTVANANDCLVYGASGKSLAARLNSTAGIAISNSLYNSNVIVEASDIKFASTSIQIYKLINGEHKIVQNIKLKTRALTPWDADKLGEKNLNEVVDGITNACKMAEEIAEVTIKYPRINGRLISRLNEDTHNVPELFCEFYGFKTSTGNVKSLNQEVYENVQVLPYAGPLSYAQAGNIFKEIKCAN